MQKRVIAGCIDQATQSAPMCIIPLRYAQTRQDQGIVFSIKTHMDTLIEETGVPTEDLSM